MKTKRVPLTTKSLDGENKIIGSCVVDIDGDTIEVTGRITDPEARRWFDNLSGLSIGGHSGNSS